MSKRFRVNDVTVLCEVRVETVKTVERIVCIVQHKDSLYFVRYKVRLKKQLSFKNILLYSPSGDSAISEINVCFVVVINKLPSIMSAE